MNRRHVNRLKTNAVRFVLSENAIPTTVLWITRQRQSLFSLILTIIVIIFQRRSGYIDFRNIYIYDILLCFILDTRRKKQIGRVFTNLFLNQFTACLHAYIVFTMTVKYLHFRFLRERRKYIYHVLKRIMHRRVESSTDAIFTCVYLPDRTRKSTTRAHRNYIITLSSIRMMENCDCQYNLL